MIFFLLFFIIRGVKAIFVKYLDENCQKMVKNGYQIQANETPKNVIPFLN